MRVCPALEPCLVPRVKFVYWGDGEWRPPTVPWGQCDHPRETLRFDPRFGLPIAVYCRLCGEAYLHPFHGMTAEEIAAHKQHVAEKYGDWFLSDEDAA